MAPVGDAPTRQVELMVRLLACYLVENKPQKEAIQFLDRVGFAPREIAQILETTPQTVSTSLYKNRKRA